MTAHRIVKSRLLRLTRIAEDMVQTGEYGLESFTERLAKNPADAFEWSQSAFDAAGQLFVGKTILAWLAERPAGTSDDGYADMILTEMRQLVFRSALYPERSTSVQSDEMGRSKATAFARVIEKMER